MAAGEGEASARVGTRGVTPEVWADIGLPPSHDGDASEEDRESPEEAPPLRTYERRPRMLGPLRDVDREVEERVLATVGPIEERLRDAELRLERANRDNEMLEVIMRTVPQRGGTGSTGGGGGPTSTPGKHIQPREYSPRGGVGPAKWLFHMGMYFEYAHVADGDRVYHGAIFLRDAAEAWWRAHVLDTTDVTNEPTADRITSWEVFRVRLSEVFTHVSEKEQARHRLYSLQQSTSVQAYTMAFRELSFAIDDLAPAESKTLYEKGLKRDVWKDVRLRFPKTLDEVITLAEQIDAVNSGMTTQARPGVRTATQTTGTAGRRFFARRGVARPQGARLNNLAAPPQYGGPQPPATRGLPILAAVRPPPRRGAAVQRPAPPRVGGMDKQRLRREGRCFLCAQLGHLAKDCPSPGNGLRRQV